MFVTLFIIGTARYCGHRFMDVTDLFSLFINKFTSLCDVLWQLIVKFYIIVVSLFI